MPQTIPMTCLQHRPDWTELKKGDLVWISGKGQTIVSGSIDDRTYDGDIVWILQHSTLERKMYHRSDGNEVWSLQDRDC